MAVALKKEVTFGTTITIREYPIIMGDNPAATGGCPITLGWTVLATTTRNLEVYEYTRHEEQHRRRRRSTTRRTKKNKKVTVLSIAKRSQLLLAAGYTQDQIIKRALEMAELQHLRQVSALEMKQGGGAFGIELLSSKKLMKGWTTIMMLGGLSNNNTNTNKPSPPPARTSLTARSA